jgi:hypothetical protein
MEPVAINLAEKDPSVGFQGPTNWLKYTHLFMKFIERLIPQIPI